MELDKTKMLMNLKTERYQQKYNIIKKYGILKKNFFFKLKAFQNIVAIFKINSIDFEFFVLIFRASRFSKS